MAREVRNVLLVPVERQIKRPIQPLIVYVLSIRKWDRLRRWLRSSAVLPAAICPLRAASFARLFPVSFLTVDIRRRRRPGQHVRHRNALSATLQLPPASSRRSLPAHWPACRQGRSPSFDIYFRTYPPTFTFTPFKLASSAGKSVFSVLLTRIGAESWRNGILAGDYCFPAPSGIGIYTNCPVGRSTGAFQAP